MLNPQGGISDPASERMRLHMPSSSFLFLFLSLSNILAQNLLHFSSISAVEVCVTPGQVRD